MEAHYFISEIQELNGVWQVVADVFSTPSEKEAHTLCEKYNTDNPTKTYSVTSIF